MSVNVFHKKNPRADMLERIATNGQKVFIGTKEVVDNAIKNKDIGNNCIVYITDDYDEKLYPRIVANGVVNADLIPVELPAGSIILTVTETPPKGFLKCDGREITPERYPRLCSIIKHAYNPNYNPEDPNSDQRILLPNQWSIENGLKIRHDLTMAHQDGIDIKILTIPAILYIKY